MRNRIIVVLACALLLLTSSKVLEVKGNDVSKENFACVSWATYYDSCEDMFEDSDVVVVGNVISSETYIVDKTVYTESTINVWTSVKGLTDDLITVMQLGGEYKGVETPFAKELPALQVDGMYYLFLQSTDGGRSDYYISGAGQGWFSIDSREEYVVKDELKDMVSMVFEERKANDALQRTLATPLNGRRLTANPTYYFFDNTVPSDTNIRNAIRRGMQAWNPYMSIQVVEGYASSLNIRIYVSYENNGLAGWVNYENNYLYIYPAGFNTAIDYNWEKVACHEMGHYIGLAHNTNGESTMHPSHENQPGYPQYPDILALSEIYP